MGHSAIRRHHQQRMKKKAIKVYPHMENGEWANHLKGCSCHMCRNPRRSKLFSGENLLTMQERRGYSHEARWCAPVGNES